MSLKDFRVVDNVGKGSFASVYKVIRKSDNKVYALKKVKINKMSKKEIADCLNEVRFLASIRQKNIVGFLEAFTENNEQDLCIIMEYCGCGDLAQKVERYKRRKTYIDEDVIWRYIIQSLKALSYMHEKGICHRDIKTANSFLAEDGSIKMGDMNVSKKLKAGQLKTQIGTPYYMSPEIWNNRPYDFSSDIWSLGCMIYELCALKPPFTGTDFPSLKRAVTAGRYSHIPKKYSESLSRVISMMLRLNPKERPTADQLLRHHEMASKLQLDEGKIAGVSFCDAEAQRKQLLQTIMVPQNLRQLNKALPKPAYPDSVQSGRGQGPSDPLPAPPVPPPPAANSRTPLAPLPENLKDARNALAADGTADSKAHHHKERARADVYKDYQPQAPPGRGREAPNAPSGANTNASAPVAPSVPYSARPGRLNMQQYEAAVRKQQQAVAQQAQNQYSQYSNNSGVERAGFQRKQSHHRIW